MPGSLKAAKLADERRRENRAEELRLGMRVEDSEDEDERRAALFVNSCPAPFH
jgi:hypothetical protein